MGNICKDIDFLLDFFFKIVEPEVSTQIFSTRENLLQVENRM